TWMVVTFSDNLLTAATGGDYDLIGWRSTDNGASWSAPFPVNTNAAFDSGADTSCDLASDGRGTWMAAWATAGLPGAADGDIAVSRSTNSGLAWSAPALVDGAAAASDSAFDSAPLLAAHPFGGWMVAWNT